MLVRPEELAPAERFFAKYGCVTVFVGRLLPVIQTFVAFPAGMARMPMLKFQVFTFLGSWPWCFVLAYVGFVLGDRWGATRPSATSSICLMSSSSLVIIVALG